MRCRDTFPPFQVRLPNETNVLTAPTHEPVIKKRNPSRVKTLTARGAELRCLAVPPHLSNFAKPPANG